MRRRINVKWLIGTVLVVVVLGGAVHWLHGYQVKRNAGVLLEQADRTEQEGKFDETRSYLERYVALVPQDTDALVRHGLLLDRLAKSDRDRLVVFFTLEKALRQAPQHHDVRRHLVRVAIALHRHTDARDHLTTLLQSFANDAELEDMLGQCEEATAQFGPASDGYARSLSHDPTRIETAVRRAQLLRRRLQRPEEADAVMDAMIEANPQSAPAFLARARYRQRYQMPELAAQDIDHVRQHLGSEDAEVLLVAAELDLARHKPDQARADFKQGLQVHPDDIRLMHGLARLELQTGRRAEAAELARRSVPLSGADSRALWTSADLLIDVGELTEAQSLLPKLEKGGVAPAPLDFLRARLCIGEARWAEARRLLEGARPQLNGSAELMFQVHLLLAHCHHHLGNGDLRVAAYRAALELDGTSVPARLGLAAATAAVGRTDEALGLYDNLTASVPTARLLAARLRLQQVLRQPEPQRKWDTIERAFQDLPEPLRQTMEGRLLWTDFLLARDRVKEAQDYLTAARKDAPKVLEFRLSLAALAAHQKQTDRVAELLDEAELDLGDRVEIRLARTQLMDRSSKDFGGLLHSLTEKTDKFSRDDQARLFRGLMQVALPLGEVKLARRIGVRLAELQPNDLEVRASLFRIALAERDPATARRLMNDLRQIEGEDGTVWKIADCGLRMLEGKDSPQWAEARARLAEVVKARPNSAPAALLEAEMCEREGNIDGAIDQYRHALVLGDRQPRVVRRVVQMLHERRRYGEAQEILRKLQDQAALSPELGRLAAEVSLLNQKAPEQTLDLARKAVAAAPADHRNQLWLGQVLVALDQRAEAEKAFRRAVELKPEAPETRVALVLFLTQTKQQAAAEVTYRETEVTLGDRLPPLMRAVCREALGERDKALEQFRAALTATPKDIGVVQATVGFYLRGALHAEAQELLRKVLGGNPEAGTAVWARRQLAVSLASSGGYARYKEALALIETNLRRPIPAVEDQRMRAIVLAMNPARRRESITALEQSFAKMPATPDEQFLLAQLYDAERDWPRARGAMLDALAATENKNPQHLTWFLTKLLQHHQTDEAEFWLPRLAKLEPKSGRTLQVTAHLRAQQGRDAEAVRLVKAWAAESKDNSSLAAAVLLEELGKHHAAEELLRQHLAATPKPEASLPLAAHLARRGRLGEALDLCEKIGADCPPELVVSVARMPRADAAICKRVERCLTTVQAKKPDSVMLQLAFADLRDVQGRFSDAETLYRQVLKRDPANAIACNNLAVLLALQNKTQEALELSERALEAEGPMPYYLDTRGLVYLASNQGEKAVRDLEEAVMLNPTATRYYHLTQAQRAVRNRSGADAAWARAKSLGLSAEVLHPLERASYASLAAEMDGK